MTVRIERFHNQKFRNGLEIPCIASAVGVVVDFTFSLLCPKATVKVNSQSMKTHKSVRIKRGNVAKFFCIQRMGNQKKLPNQIKINFIMTSLTIHSFQFIYRSS